MIVDAYSFLAAVQCARGPGGAAHNTLGEQEVNLDQVRRPCQSKELQENRPTSRQEEKDELRRPVQTDGEKVNQHHTD